MSKIHTSAGEEHEEQRDREFTRMLKRNALSRSMLRIIGKRKTLVSQLVPAKICIINVTDEGRGTRGTLSRVGAPSKLLRHLLEP
jgi:hypothetical protein